MRRRYEYRYRSGQAGVTHYSEERLHHLSKIGKLKYIRGLAFKTKFEDNGHPTIRLAVIVRGDKGYARFDGFCWGYGGTGPHGLRRLFEYFRIPSSIAVHIAHDGPECPGYDKAREFWRLNCDSDCETFEVLEYDKHGEVKRTKYGISTEELPVQQRLPLNV